MVIQKEPGVRLRRLVYCVPDFPDHEPLLGAFMRILDKAREQGYWGEISKAELRAAMGLPLEVSLHW
jgi:hypothetical protein